MRNFAHIRDNRGYLFFVDDVDGPALRPHLERRLLRPNPDSGKWNWPFAKMLPGDWFEIEPALKSVGTIRNYAGVTGDRLGMRLSVKRNPETGNTIIRRVDGSPEQAESMSPSLKWSELAPLVERAYQVEAGTLPWDLATREGVMFKADRVEHDVPEDWLHVMIARHGYDVKLEADGILCRLSEIAED